MGPNRFDVHVLDGVVVLQGRCERPHHPDGGAGGGGRGGRSPARTGSATTRGRGSIAAVVDLARCPRSREAPARSRVKARHPPTRESAPARSGVRRPGSGGQARFGEDRLGEAGSVKPRRTEAKASGRQPRPADRDQVVGGASGHSRAGPNEGRPGQHRGPSPVPAGNSNVRRTIVWIQMPIVRSSTMRILPPEGRERPSAPPGPMVPSRGRSPGPGPSRLRCGTTSTGRSVNSARARAPPHRRCRGALRTWRSPRQGGGPDLGLAEEPPRRGPLAGTTDSTPDRRANSPMCSTRRGRRPPRRRSCRRASRPPQISISRSGARRRVASQVAIGADGSNRQRSLSGSERPGGCRVPLLSVQILRSAWDRCLPDHRGGRPGAGRA